MNPFQHNKIIERYPDGSYFEFDHTHYYEVWKARKEKGFPVTEHVILEDHVLVGKHMFDRSTGKAYVVEQVIKEWYAGWYIKLLIRDENCSHGVRAWENLSCFDPMILEQIREHKNDMYLI
jgi:hypothetical protein